MISKSDGIANNQVRGWTSPSDGRCGENVRHPNIVYLAIYYYGLVNQHGIICQRIYRYTSNSQFGRNKGGAFC